jgi:hypothetical protein
MGIPHSESSQVDEFTAWLNPKGNRELALRNTLAKWWPHIVPGIRKRLSVSLSGIPWQAAGLDRD